MLKGQDLFGAMKNPSKIPYRISFVVSGIVCYTLPSILAGGHAMISLITGHTLLVSTMLLLLVAKFSSPPSVLVPGLLVESSFHC